MSPRRRPPLRGSRAARAGPALLAALSAALVAALLSGCSSPERARDEAAGLLRAGDAAGAEERVRQGLEADEDDLELLLLAGEIALSTTPQEAYKPRLALHYALRAERAADHRDPRTAALLLRAWRANGGSDDADDLLRRGLAEVGHPDARAPRRPGPVDPDLVAPTTANLREQRRRDALRAAGADPCAPPLGFVAAGPYALPGGDVDVAPYCTDRHGVPGTCAARALRSCSADERAVACGPLVAVLGPHPSCGDPTAERCCGAPATHWVPASR